MSLVWIFHPYFRCSLKWLCVNLQKQAFADVPHSRCCWKCGNIHRKIPVLGSYLSKVAGLQACKFIKKETPTQVFFCEYSHIYKYNFFIEHLWWLHLNLLCFWKFKNWIHDCLSQIIPYFIMFNQQCLNVSVIIRSIRSQMFFRVVVVPKNLAIFTGKHMLESVFNKGLQLH